MTQTKNRSVPACPLARASQLIGDLWTILIIKQLLSGPKRFCELEDSINSYENLGDISSRTLTQRLKALEQSKLIHHEVHPQTTTHAEYRLTPKGQALEPVLSRLADYGEQFL